jgi:hypothetical protein
MEPAPYSLPAALRGALILVLSLAVFAQIPPAPDTSGFPSARKAHDFPLTAVPPAFISCPPFEFRGIRIGDEMKDAERKFLALKTPSPHSNPGLCGPDGIDRIETCTDVLGTGEYVNLTIFDKKVAQIYVSDHRTESNAYNGFLLALATKYGSPERSETRYYRNGRETGSSGEQVRWSNGNQYMQGSEIERAITIGSAVLDAQIAEAERLHEHN